MSKFQIILLSVFIAFGVGGLLAFAVIKGKSVNNTQTPVVIWGTLDSTAMYNYLNTVQNKTKSPYIITYVQKSDATIYSDYTDAVASGNGPDALLISQDLISTFGSKLFPIPFTSLSQSVFNNTFIQEANLYVTQNGILALPFSIDPMVMYWNRDIFTNANLVYPPSTWDQFVTLAPQLTTKDTSLNIIKSAAGLGEYPNITHAKDLVSLLIMQTGNPIVTQNASGNDIATLTGSDQSSETTSALNFYTQFSDPTKQAYTWNRALPDSQDLFIANRLGVYFGYASEQTELEQKNPNLNIGVSLMPQLAATNGIQPTQMTFGKLYGLSISKSSKNIANTFTILTFLIGKDNLNLYSTAVGLPSVRRDSLAPDPSNPFGSVFTTSALWSRAWPDPNSASTDSIFSSMIENITSGFLSVDQSIANANGKLQNLLQ